MKIYFMALVAACLLFACEHAAAQALHVSGKILLETHKPADAATVLLLNEADTINPTMAVAEADGQYRFDGVAKGHYKLSVSLLGYQQYAVAGIVLDSVSVEWPDIVLQQNGSVLKEVGITANKAFVVQKLDKTIVNVDGMITAAGLSALDVLARSPGVQVDNNGTISLKGKQNVTIFIDGKPTYLSGDDLQNYLKSLPSSSLDQLEIMPNPPAKYDAAGNGGIINIKTKKNSQEGFNAGLTLSLNQGKLTRSNNSLNANYRSGKLNLFANVSYNFNNSFTDLDINRVYTDASLLPTSYFQQNSYFRRHGNTLSIKTGADYYWSDKTTIGIVFTGMDRQSDQRNNSTSNLLNQYQDLDSVIVANNYDHIHFNNTGINLNYRTQFNKTGHELTADADYIAYRNRTNQTYYNYSYLPDQTLQSQDILSGQLPSDIDIYSFKADYNLPLQKDWVFAAGIKSSYTHTDNLADYANTIENITTPDYNKSNHFLYDENINAGYLNLKREGRKLSVQAGLRLENTGSKGHQLGNVVKADSSFDRHYTSFFPTIYLSYKLDTAAVNQIGLNYGRRIDRPYYEDLNPFISPIDKFTYYTGNPFLKPAFTQSVQLSHTYKNKITTTLLYSKSKDDINEAIRIVDGIYYSSSANIGSKTVKSLSVDADLDPLKTLNVHLYSELTNLASESALFDRRLSTSGTFWYISANAKWSLPKSFTLELNGNYRTKVYDAQFIVKNLWQMNIAVQKKLGNQCNLRLGLNDVFYSNIVYGTITNLDDAIATWRNKQDSRNVSLSFSYRFGKTFEDKRKHTTNGAESEQNRVKN